MLKENSQAFGASRAARRVLVLDQTARMNTLGHRLAP